ncbi:hypothetical protein FS749_013821 [Ceratobasidium sp. UAMH 11750]|nr:hypothetical protein FS749_013821 [Ceratobasidium sp. UAMH 11750]
MKYHLHAPSKCAPHVTSRLNCFAITPAQLTHLIANTRFINYLSKAVETYARAIPHALSGFTELHSTVAEVARESHPASDSNKKYYDYVDDALATVREQTAGNPEVLQAFFESVLQEDEKLFSKAINQASDPRERDEWQAQVEAASGRLAKAK